MIILVIALFAAAAAYVFWPYIMNFNKGAEKVLTPEEQQQFVADLIKTGDLNQCQKAQGMVINGTDYFQVCLNNIDLNLAQEKGDLSYCDQLQGNDWDKTLCKRDTITKKISSGEGNFCPSLTDPGLKNFCTDAYWSRDALANETIASCDKVIDSVLKFDCQDAVHTVQLVSNTKGFSCKIFHASSLGSDCDTYILALTSSKLSTTTCASIGTVSIMQACLSRVHNQNTNL